MKTDVCIIGGGVMGLCSAYYLNAAGFEVTILDRSDMNSGASYVNAGYVSPSHIIPLSAPGMPWLGLKYMFNPESPFYLKARWDSNLWRWGRQFVKHSNNKHVKRSAPVLKAFLDKSKSLYKELASTEDLDFGYTDSGLLMLCQTEEKLASETKTARFAREQALDVEFLNKEEIALMEPDNPPEAIGGVLYRDDSLLVPNDFMGQMQQILRKNGVEILTGTKVERIQLQKGNPAFVETGDSSISFRKLVIASGAWSPALLKMLGVRLLLQAGKGYSFELPNPGIRYPAILCERKVAVSPMESRVRFGGTMELAGMDESINSGRVEAIRKAAESYYPGIKINKNILAASRHGLRPVSPDGMPYIGKLRKFENVFLATGHAMIGMSLGPATGLLVSEMLQGKPTFMETGMFDPDRFG